MLQSETLRMESTFNNIFRKRKFELAPKNTYRKKLYSCSQCTISFSQRSNLKPHQRKHIGETPYQEKPLIECTKSFSQRGKLKIHLRTHTGEKPYQCTICTKYLPRNGHLKSHLRIHTGEKTYKCH